MKLVDIILEIKQMDSSLLSKFKLELFRREQGGWLDRKKVENAKNFKELLQIIRASQLGEDWAFISMLVMGIFDILDGRGPVNEIKQVTNSVLFRVKKHFIDIIENHAQGYWVNKEGFKKEVMDTNNYTELLAVLETSFSPGVILIELTHSLDSNE